MSEKLEVIGEKGLLVDTDILIDYLRGFSLAKDFIPFILEKFKVYITLVNVAEIYAGKEMRNLRKRTIVANFLNQFFILGFNLEIAKLAGDLKRDYQLSFGDAFTAGASILFDLVLVTRNVKDYRRVQELKIFIPY